MQSTRNLKQSRKNRLIMLVEATKIDLINHALQLLPKVEGILLPFSKIIRDSYKKRNEKSKKTFQKYFPRPPRKSNKNDKSKSKVDIKPETYKPGYKKYFQISIKGCLYQADKSLSLQFSLSRWSKNDQRERNLANIKGSKSSF